MNFLLRIPGWLLSLMLSLSLGLFFLLIFLPAPLFNIANDGLYRTVHNSDDYIIMLLLLNFLLLNVLGLALTLKHLEEHARAALLVVPLLLSLCFLMMILPVGIESTLSPPAGVLQSLSTAIEDFVDRVTPKVFFLTGLGFMLAAICATTYCLVRLLARNRREWLLIPLSVIFLPVGLWWLQPRWRPLADRKQPEQTADHLVE